MSSADPTAGRGVAAEELTDSDYRSLLAFRSSMRRFLRWSDAEAVRTGLTAAQHQLLLATRGHPDPAGPSVGDVADALVLHHHGAVGLIDRAAAAAGLVRRRRDPSDHRIVRLRLTPAGSRRLAELSARHLQELERLHRLRSLWEPVLPGANARAAAEPRPDRDARSPRRRPSS